MPRNFQYGSSLQRLSIYVPFILLLFTGCQQRNEVIAGVEIPIPKNMTKNTDKPIAPVPGLEAGQVSYEGKVTPAEIFTFYQEVMAAKGWQPTARFADQKDQIAYTKENRVGLDPLQSSAWWNDNPHSAGSNRRTDEMSEAETRIS